MQFLLAIHKKTIVVILFLFGFSVSFAQRESGTGFTSSDKELELAFNWARSTALHYQGSAADPVGPWYESALPSRFAFCMRDLSHQCIGGEILGLSPENHNMLTLFARNISDSKDWCSYWEINKWSRPAPEDYLNDKEFWYNLPANFDILYATWRMYLWTGDKSYIDNPAFTNFQEKTVTDYIERWVLDADSLLTRPAHPNAPVPFNEENSFHRCRGLPSYSEGVPDLKTGADLVAALYQGMLTYSAILTERGLKEEAVKYAQKAEIYRQKLENEWWDQGQGRYHSYYSNDNNFGQDEGATFLLWFDALKDSVRINKTLTHLASQEWNVENTSYLPFLFYKHGYWDQARKYILYLADPSTARREYPEVSFGVIEGIVQGLMGITPDVRTRTISTLFKTTGQGNAVISRLSIIRTMIDLAHINNHRSMITNTGKESFKWKAMFKGKYRKAYANGVLVPLKNEKDIDGKIIFYTEINVKPGNKITVNVEN
ncbi:MAG: hypothetical protein ABIQ31_05150 [Ferruginibacter sp.]